MGKKPQRQLPSFGQLPNRFVVTLDQRLFLCPEPTLDLPFDSNGVGDVRKVLCPDEDDGKSLGSIAAIDAVVVLGDASIKTLASRAYIVSAILRSEACRRGRRLRYP